MKFYTFIVFSVAIFISSTAEELTLPVKTCKRNSNDYNTCMKRAVIEAWPRVAKGLPEFQFPTLDPLSLDYEKNTIDQGELHGEIIIRNGIVTGMKKTRFLGVRSNFADDIFHLEIDIHIPWIYIDADCEATGYIGGLRMGGEGHFNITMGDIKMTWDMTGPVANDTWTITRFHVVPLIGKFKILFRDLFQGDKELNNIATTLVNEFWPSLYRVVLPVGPQNWDSFLSSRANLLFSKVSFSKIFPSD